MDFLTGNIMNAEILLGGMAICYVWFKKISIPQLFPFPWKENLMGFIRGGLSSTKPLTAKPLKVLRCKL